MALRPDMQLGVELGAIALKRKTRRDPILSRGGTDKNGKPTGKIVGTPGSNPGF